MHDVVAHRVSLMVVHAAALRAVLRSDPEQAAASAELMGDMGRQALEELRQMLGVLRTVEGPAGPAVGQPSPVLGPADPVSDGVVEDGGGGCAGAEPGAVGVCWSSSRGRPGWW